MSNKAKLALTFLRWTVWFGLVAFVIVWFTAVRTCGMTPDSAELCDLTALNIVQVVLGVSYLAMATYFYRTRVSGRI